MKLLNILAALVLGLAIAMLAAVARAQSYDPESRWIGKTIRKQLRSEESDRYYGYDVPRHSRAHEYRDRWRHSSPRRHYYAEPRRGYIETITRPDRDRYRDRDHDHHRGTRVYGIVTRKGDTMVRDATGSIECFPAIEARSHERQSEDNAWDDAQRSWQNTVRWKYGERFQNIQHASAIERRCNVSTISESVAGKIVEQVKGAFSGDDNGRRWRCEVRASPCMAPADRDPTVKGDPKL